MSQKNVDLVQRAFQHFLETGEVMRELVHEDVVIHWNPDIPGSQTYHGPDGLERALNEWQKSWEETDYEFFQMTDAGDHVLAGFRETTRGRGGVTTTRDWFQVYTIKDGKLAMLREFSDQAEALEAAELDNPISRLRAWWRDKRRERA
jgi:ketosteroid isomerase-like protein